MLRKCLFDIEVYSPDKFPLPEDAEFPINSNTIYDSYTDHYISIIIDLARAGLVERNVLDPKTGENNWDIYHVKDERELIILSVKLIKYMNFDFIGGWFSDTFDVPYFFNRCHNLEMKNALNSISPMNYVDVKRKKITGMHMADLVILDKKIKKRTSYTLENVAIEEKLSVQKLEKHEDIMEIYRNDKDRFVKYNKGDVEILAELEKKNHIIDFYENTRVAFGLNDIMEALRNSVVVDVAALRKAYKEGIVLPSKSEVHDREDTDEEEDEKQGGAVKFPPPGIHHNVVVLDMAKFYPAILGLLNLSAETIVAINLTKDQIKKEEGFIFVEYEDNKYCKVRMDVKGFMPSLYQEFLAERLKVEAEMKKFSIDSPEYNFLMQKRQVVKDTSNSLPGVNGYGGFRLNSIVVYNSIIHTGVKYIKKTEKMVTDMGLDDIYGDSVIGETNIIVNRKEIKIEKLFERYNRFKFKENEKDIINTENLNLNTITIDKNGKIMSKPISKIIRHKTTKKLYEVKTESGKSIVVTEDEGLLVFCDDKIKTITPKECIGKEIFVPIINYDKVECQICNNEFTRITNTHLERHNLTIEKYHNTFPSMLTTSLLHRDQMKKKKVWNKDKPWSDEVKEKLVSSHKGQASWNKGLKKDVDERVFRHVTSEKRRNKISKASKEMWKDPEYIKLMTLISNVKPNKLEQIFIDEFDFIDYVGDGNLFIRGRCPDFRVKNKQKLIEVFGNYWHKGEDPSILINHYKKYGWECIVIWESEVHNDFNFVKKKVIDFASN